MISSMTLLRATMGLIACTACVAQGAGLPTKAFGSILQEDVQWAPFPAFPEQARLAVLVGEPAKAGPYLVRVKVPAGVTLMPHTHPEDRIYTCLLYTSDAADD